VIVRESGGIPFKAGLEVHTAAEESYEAAAIASHPTVRSCAVRCRDSVSLAACRRASSRHRTVQLPLILSIRSVAPALALGNAVILKPDPRTAVCGGVVSRSSVRRGGLPAGVFSVLPGGADVGEALVMDPLIRIIAFTGSTAAGPRRRALAAQHLKRVHLELAGTRR